MPRIPVGVAGLIRKDRLAGLSIPQLASKYGIPRSSIWRLSHDVILLPEVQREIQSRRGGSKKRKKVRLELARIEAADVVQKNFSKASLPFILSSLYWAEGTKSSFVFTNTDADMIRLFLAILRDIFNVSDERLQILIRIGNNQSSHKILAHWSSIVGISVSKINLNVHERYNKTKAPNGLCRITIVKGAPLLKLIMAINKEMTRIILK